MWGGPSGHVLAHGKESTAEIETKTSYVTPHLDIFVTYFVLFRLTEQTRPVPAIPHTQETPFPELEIAVEGAQQKLAHRGNAMTPN